MVYVMSDLHGCYEMYVKMLEKIEFGPEDTLYVLGDVLDRGPSGIKALLDIGARQNVVLLRGNHDQMAAVLLSRLHILEDESEGARYRKLMKSWLSDGGETTLQEFLALEAAEQDKVLLIIRESLLSKEIEVGGQRFLLSHTVPEKEEMKEIGNCTFYDFLMGEPDYEEVYFDDIILVTGHTPTSFIDPVFTGRIWKQNNHIAIDCGAVFGNGLGCLCLDTMEEFYVK